MSLKVHPGQYYIYPEDDMPESQAQIDLGKYLTAVLEYFYRMQPYFITGNLAVISPGPECPFEQIVPDVMVVEGVTLTEQERRDLTSWNMKHPNRPAPMTVFEVSSEHTWGNDLDPKPEHYRVLGVREYFAYDPQGYWPTAVRLRGWRYANRQIQEIFPQPGESRLWSQTLQSWVVPAGAYLRLTDQAGNIRLTGEEAEQRARQASDRAREAAEQARAIAEQQAEAERLAKEAARRDKEVERQAREAARQQIEAERQAREAEQQAKEQALQQAEVERQRAEAAQRARDELLEKLRRHNIDPDALS